jgi:hypothetical protein
MEKILKQIYLATILLKGCVGSGNFGHEGRPGEIGGSGGGASRFTVPAHLKQTFESGTVPLRSKLKLDDQVAFLDNGKLRIAQVDFGGDKNTLSLIDYKTGEKFMVPKEFARMPKGGYRTRGE